MSPGNRDELWNSSWDTYYDSYYYEIAISKVISRWKIFDLITKVLVAITATGSAIAGWSLWSQGASKEIWAVLAGTAAILSIIHAVTQVQSILETNTKFRSSFSSTRVALESFRQQLAIFRKFKVSEKNIEFQSLRTKYENLVSKFSGDILLTDTLANSAQSELNKKLGVNINV